jgi:hypothetical protein
MPTPRKPPALKAISGSREPSPPMIELPVLPTVPAAPSWLPNAHAVNEWDRLAAMLVANGMLTDGGLTPLAVLCSLAGKIVQLNAAGESPTGHMIAQYRGLCNDFGLTPVAQGKVRPAAAPVAEGNRFAKFGSGKP